MSEPGQCLKCAHPFDPDDSRFDGYRQNRETPFCRRCANACHDTEIADHWRVIDEWSTRGEEQGRSSGSYSIPSLLSPGRRITDPDEAESLGLNVDAKRMRHGVGNSPSCTCCVYQRPPNF